MVSRTAAGLAATLLAAIAQLSTYGPALLVGPLELTPRTTPLVAGGLSFVGLLVGPVGAALLGSRLDGDLRGSRAATLGLFALAGTVGYVLAFAGFVLAAPGGLATPFEPLVSTLGSALLRAPAAVVPFALAGFAGAAYAYVGRGDTGEARRRAHGMGGSDGAGGGRGRAGSE